MRFIFGNDFRGFSQQIGVSVMLKHHQILESLGESAANVKVIDDDVSISDIVASIVNTEDVDYLDVPLVLMDLKVVLDNLLELQ